MKPKLILFDFSGTLAFLRDFTVNDFFPILGKLGLFFATREEKDGFVSFCCGTWGMSKSWPDLSRRLLEKYIRNPTEATIAKLARFLRERVGFELYEDVKEIVNLPFPKAILSANAGFLIKETGLGKFFKIFTPKETKFLKPDPRAFLAVLNKFKIKPEEALMVGNELERDLIPAKNLGMETILIDRENKIKDSPTRKIGSLAELKDILV